MPITIVEERPDSVDAVQLITELDTHLNRQLYPQESRHAFSIDKLVREAPSSSRGMMANQRGVAA